MTRPIRFHRALVLIAALLLAWVLGCTQEAGPLEFDNPLDPDGTDDGDPFDLSVGYVNGAVLVNWTALDMEDIAGYEVMRSLVAGGSMSIIGSTDATVSTYSDTLFAPNAVNYYKVRAVDADGAGSATSHIAATAFAAPPRLVIGDGSGITATPLLDLFVASSTGEQVEADSLSDFSTSSRHDLDENGEVTFAWDLGSAAAADEWKYLYIRVHEDGTAGDAYLDSVQVSFAPSLGLDGNPDVIGVLDPTLSISGDGIIEMRFADSRASLESAVWMDYADLYEGYLLEGAVADSQLVFGEFSSEFGFTVVDSVWAVPDSLNTIAFTIESDAESTADIEVQVGADVAATQMRFAQSVEDLALAGWSDYAASADFVLDGCEGGTVETVYAQYRNAWFSPDPVSDDIQWLPPEVLDVTIVAPDTVSSEETVTITGTAVAGTCGAPLDLVEFYANGAWSDAPGLEDWSFEWTAQAVESATAQTLKARVTAGAETDSVEVEVIITP